jgi:hypothetical protein
MLNDVDENLPKIKCASCGFIDSGNFCSQCGHRITDGGSIFGDLTHNLLPLNWILTVIRCVFMPNRFFSEIKSNDWSKKYYPVPFLISCCVFVIIAEEFLGSSYYTVTWYDIYTYTDPETEDPFFFEILGVSDFDTHDIDSEIFHTGSSTASKIIRNNVGSIEASNVINYIQANQHEYGVNLASGMRENLQKIHQEKKYNSIIESVVFPIAFIFAFWYVGSKMLSSDRIERSKSFEIICYIFGVSYFIQMFVEIILWSFFVQDGEAISSINRVVLIPLYIWTYYVIKTTHGVGFWRQSLVGLCMAATALPVLLILAAPPYLITDYAIWGDRSIVSTLFLGES